MKERSDNLDVKKNHFELGKKLKFLEAKFKTFPSFFINPSIFIPHDKSPLSTSIKILPLFVVPKSVY